MMRENSTFDFWRPRRPLRAFDPVTRCRPRRQRSSVLVRRPNELTVKLEVEKFKIYGKLRPTETRVNNSLPSADTIQTEKTLMSFEEKRRTAPENVLYDDFYRSLTTSITPLPSRPETLRSSRLSSRGPETPKTTMFTLFPHLLIQRAPLLPSTPSVVSRVVTSYGLRPSESLLDVLRPGDSDRSALGSRVPSRELSREFSQADSEPSSYRCLDVEENHSSYSSRV